MTIKKEFPSKPKKERSKTYEKPLKIQGTFLQAVKSLVKENKK